MPRSASPLVVSPAEQIILEAVVASEEIPESVRKRARVVLLAADGAANCTIAREVSLARPRVVFWRQRFGEQGIRGLWDLEGVRPQDRIPEAAELGIVIDCLYRPRMSGAVCKEQMLVDPSINWNVKNLARRHRVSPASVQRVWKKHGIRMLRHRKADRGVDLGQLKISQDPLFGITVYEIAGLYYQTSSPVLALCSREPVFSELKLWTGSGMARQEIAADLAARLRGLQQRSFGRPEPAVDKFIVFLQKILGNPRHRDARIHLLLESPEYGVHRMGAAQAFLAEERCIHMHYAPWRSGGHRWSPWAERWLQVIAGWPLQTSFIASANQLGESLRRLPKGKFLDSPVVC